MSTQTSFKPALSRYSTTMSDASTASSAHQSPHSHSHLHRRLFIQMSGAPGSGKSTTANLLAQKIDGFAVPHDTIKSALLEENIPFDKAAKIAYRMDWALAEEVIKQGRSVIIDSPCNYQEALDQGRALATRYGYAYWYLEIRTDVHNLALLDARLRTRTPLRAQRACVDENPTDAKEARHTQADAQARFKRWVNPCRPDGNIIVVDTAGNLQERIDYILNQLPTTAVGEEPFSARTT